MRPVPLRFDELSANGAPCSFSARPVPSAPAPSAAFRHVAATAALPHDPATPRGQWNFIGCSIQADIESPNDIHIFASGVLGRDGRPISISSTDGTVTLDHTHVATR